MTSSASADTGVAGSSALLRIAALLRRRLLLLLPYRERFASASSSAGTPSTATVYTCLGEGTPQTRTVTGRTS